MSAVSPRARAPSLVAEELDRVLPVIEAIRSRSDIFISVDTSRLAVMREALALGANLINDVWAFRREPTFDVAVSERAPVCVMHMQGEPGTMQRLNMKTLSQSFGVLVQHASRFIDVGYKPEQVWVDPGIGFGKKLAHNLALLAGVPRLKQLGFLSCRTSRKSMIGRSRASRLSVGYTARWRLR